ncbi:hypothetical protein BDM02DRAFT_3119199 [Thelephora ganbajun]|uniref:Uncharacterized protein n=1 Tax=Thelephora ganbajun TaxID=370292 RepID=A0ACB6Z9K9_THEGA|nr:hypothetical protein BDM02DRAFT_3119199 [Thelephora ganbajun]
MFPPPRPTANQPAQTNGTLTTSASDRVPRVNQPSPGIQMVVPAKHQSTNPPESSRPMADSVRVPRKLPSDERPATEVQRVTPTKRQSIKSPGSAPTKHQSVNPPGSSHPPIRFAPILTPENMYRRSKCRLCKQQLQDGPNGSGQACPQCSVDYGSMGGRNKGSGVFGLNPR